MLLRYNGLDDKLNYIQVPMNLSASEYSRLVCPMRLRFVALLIGMLFTAVGCIYRSELDRF